MSGLESPTEHNSFFWYFFSLYFFDIFVNGDGLPENVVLVD